MICIDELKDLKLYSRPLYLPINMKNKKKGSSVFLLTPNYESSMKTMKLPYIINNNLFQSYYMEKNVNYYITNESAALLIEGDTYIHGIMEFDNSLKNPIEKRSIYDLDNYFIKMGDKIVNITPHSSIDDCIKEWNNKEKLSKEFPNKTVVCNLCIAVNGDMNNCPILLGSIEIDLGNKEDEYKSFKLIPTVEEVYVNNDTNSVCKEMTIDLLESCGCLNESVKDIANKYKMQISDLYNKSKLNGIISKIKSKNSKEEKFDESIELSKDLSKVLGYSAGIAMLGNPLTFPVGLLVLTIKTAKASASKKSDIKELESVKKEVDTQKDKIENVLDEDKKSQKLSKEERAELERRLDELVDASDEMDDDEFDRLYDEISDKLDADDEIEEAALTYPTKTSVSGLIENQDHKYLIIFSKTLNMFNLPGGKVEYSDSLDDTLVRELNEELNITPVRYDMLFKSNGLCEYADGRTNPNMYLNDTTYLVRSYNGILRNMEPNKCKGYKWMSAKEIMNLPEESTSFVLKKLIHLFKTGKIATGIKATWFDYKEANVTYYGYKSDIPEVKKLINDRRIKEVSRELGLYKSEPYALDVIIGDSFLDSSSYNTIYVMSKKKYDDNYVGKYTSYINEILYSFLLKKAYPKCNDFLISAVAEYKVGAWKERLNDPLYSKDYFDLDLTLENIEKSKGMSAILDILKKNDVKKLYTHALNHNLGTHFNEAVLNEKKDNYITNVTQLMRRSKMKAKRGSEYKINAIQRFIDKATNPDEPMPEVKDVDGNILNPTTAPDLRKTIAGAVNKGIEKPDNPPEEPAEEINVESNYINESDSDIMMEYSIYHDEDIIMIDEEVFTEAEASINSSILKKLLYRDRIKQTKEIKDIYTRVKSENENIKYTYFNLNRYKELNLFVDLSYYNEVFFRNNSYKKRKGLNVYSSMLSKLLYADRFDKAGYNKKTVFIPVNDWDNDPKTKMWMYNEDINPISIIYNGMKTTPQEVKNLFQDMDVVFVTDTRYFKINFSHFTPKDITREATLFLKFIKSMRSDTGKFIEPEEGEIPGQESKKAIVMNITDKLEKSQGIKIVNFNVLGKAEDTKKEVVKSTTTKTIANTTANTSTDNKESQKKGVDDKKKELLDAIDKAADVSLNTDEALEELDTDKIKQLIIDLASEEEEGVKINQARASRMLKLQNDLVDKEVNGKKIKDLLTEDKNKKEIPTTDLKIASINEDWSKVKYINFDKEYDIDADIVAIINNMANYSRPIATRDINTKDTSTTEDFIITYTCDLEDYNGKRFSLKFDVPKFIENNYMVLRGNKKTINLQSFLMPIVKTDVDTCQIISNYNKIFIRRSTNLPGKSLPNVDRLIKAINKYKGNIVKVYTGDNSVVCNRYELPIDYIDLASVYGKIEAGDYIIYFNQDEIRKLYKVDETKGIPFAVIGKNHEIVYYNAQDLKNAEVFPTISSYIESIILTADGELKDIYDSVKASPKHVFSEASILNNKIPLIVIMAYSEGLVSAMKKSDITYTFKEKLDKDDRLKISLNEIDTIRFSDGYILYDVNYASSLLMNGLKQCDTEDYSLNDINSKTMYIDFLDDFGGRILADGLDVFYDCMIDAITKNVLSEYHLPTDYVSVLAQANILLSDNKYIKHSDYSFARRLRREEIIAAYVHKAISTAYSSYVQQLKRNRNNASFTMKQSAVIDLVMQDPILSDKSFINALSDVEDKNSVSTKGLSGMNSDRSYNLDKRTYDESMINVLGMSTGFAGTVGITRQTTIDSNLEGVRGFVKTSNKDEMGDVKSLTMTEALTPLGSTHDDPIRTAMTFVQTAKHNAATFESDPLLVTNGSDEALAYYTSDIFAFKAKGNGKVIEKTDDYMIVEYKNGKHDYINIAENIEKNSNGGYYVPLQHVTDLKVGSTFKKNDIIAHEKYSFSNSLGETDGIAYNVGKLTKVAILNTDESFEDSAIVTNKLAKAMGTNIIIKKEVTIPKSTNVFNIVKKGQSIIEGDTLMIMQSPSDEEDINILLKNLAGDEEDISDLGRIPIKSKVTGRVADIKISRTIEIEEMSESLQKIVKSYENGITKNKSILKKFDIDTNVLPSTSTLAPIGKLKNAEDSVVIEFFLEYKDIMAIGDKLVYYSANKGVTKYIIPDGKEPYTDFRPNETIDAFVGIASINKRMVTSTVVAGSLNKLMIELDRSCKDIAGIPWSEEKL